MPGGYGTDESLPWGAGGESYVTPGQTSSPYVSGAGPTNTVAEQNMVAQAANQGVNDLGQNLQEALAASGQSSAPAMVQGIINAQNAQAAAAAAEAQAAAAAAAAAQEDTWPEKFMASIMGGTPDPTVLKPQFQQPGKHKLRAQYDYLLAKYGDKWAETTQAKELANYLSGVPVERGGGLGARDETYGGGPTENIDPEMEEGRRALLEEWPSLYYDAGIEGKLPKLWKRITKEEFGKDLTPEQWFNFRQQLMASDPSPGNVDYKEAFPWSSGSGVAALASPALSITKDILGIESVAPAEYQGHMGQTFYDTSTPEYGGGGGGQGIADLSPVAQLAATTPEEVVATVPEEVVATVPEEVVATTTVPGTTTTPTPFDYSQWPQFTSAYPGHYANLGSAYANLGPNYVNQGLGQWPQFNYWNQIANAFPGMS